MRNNGKERRMRLKHRERGRHREQETEGEEWGVLIDGSIKVKAPSVSFLFVCGSRDTLGKQSRNRALVLPGSPSQSGVKGLVEQERQWEE